METTEATAEHSILTPGTVIAGRYEVLEKIGSGGMGAVLRVLDRALENDVMALKILFPRTDQHKTSLARFRNEVLLTRKLAHPNIVRLYDLGSAGSGFHYITMEYVEGTSLAQRIHAKNEEKLAFPEILRILFEICAALDYAHRMEIIHRDLKPDNILLAPDGTVKVTDFGLARSLEVDKGLTNTGETVGTPHYMAPEQFRGERPDRRTDIYSLGIMAYELVTGKKPFAGDVYVSLATMHLNHPIPKFATKDSDIPRWFQDFVEICAEKKPKDRYQSMAEVAEELYEEMLGIGISPDELCRHFSPVGYKGKGRKKDLFWPLSCFLK